MGARQPGLLFIAVCVAALALRLILPAGWMPVASADGVVIGLCSGTVAPGDPAAPAGTPDQPCDYALALGPLLLAGALLLPLLALPVLPILLVSGGVGNASAPSGVCYSRWSCQPEGAMLEAAEAEKHAVPPGHKHRQHRHSK